MKKFFLLTFFFYVLNLNVGIAQAYQWAKKIGYDKLDYGNSIIANGSSLILSGTFSGTVDFDPGSSLQYLNSWGWSNDAYIAKYDTSGNYLWAKKIGSNVDDWSRYITLDMNGNILITGSFQQTVVLDQDSSSINLTSAGSFDIFFAKYDSIGNFLWARRIGSYDDDGPSKVDFDSYGNIYLTGGFTGTVDFDPGSDTSNLISNGGKDIFFAKYDPNGNYLWAKNIGSGGIDGVSSFILDDNGNIYIIGSFTSFNSDSTDFDPGTGTAYLIPVGGNADVFFAKYDSDGNYLWAKSIGSVSTDVGYGIKLDSNDNILITGYFSGQADFDPGPDTSFIIVTGSNTFFAKYDSSGNYLWSKHLAGYNTGYNIYLDASENIFLCGGLYGVSDFDPDTGIFNISPVGQPDSYLAKYDPAGKLLWAYALNIQSTFYSQPLAFDGIGNIYVTGTFFNSADFNPGPGTVILNSAGASDIFFAKYYDCSFFSPIDIVPVVNDVSCFGNNDGSVSINISGGHSPYNYSWSNGSTGNSLDSLISGTYQVTVLDSLGCFKYCSVNVNQPDPAISLTYSNTSISCNNGINDGEIFLSASGGNGVYQYSIDGGNTFQDSSSFYNLASGIYYVQVKDSNNCYSYMQADTLSFTPSSIIINVVSNIKICNGSDSGNIMIGATGGTGNLTYLWSTNDTTNYISNLSVGNYTITVTDSSGCYNSATIAVAPVTIAINTIENLPTCSGSNYGSITVAATGDYGGFSFLWTTGDTTSQINNLSVGTYAVTVTDSLGCTATKTINVNPVMITINTVAYSSSCSGGSNGSAAVVANGGSGNYSYIWSTGDTTDFANNLAPGAYAVTATDSIGCSNIKTITISAVNINLNVLNYGSSCSGNNNGSLIVSSYGGMGTINYSWSTGETNSAIYNLSLGNYSLTVTDSLGCTTDTTLILMTNNSAAWIRKADFSGIARYAAVGFSIGNKGYIGTGNSTTGNKNDFWEYDPATNIWTQKANFGGTARYGAVGFSIGSKGYIGTGHDASLFYPYKKDFYEYDPASNTWTQKAAFPGARREAAVGFSIGNRGYIGLGDDNNVYMADFWEYDPLTNSWSQKATFSGGARNALGFSIGSKGYVGTGYDGNYYNDFWEYNPSSNSWVKKADFGGTKRAGSFGFSIGSYGYLGGGIDINYAYVNDFWKYDPVSDTWEKKSDFPGSGRYLPVAFSIGNNGYVGTGFIDFNLYTNEFWEYSPSQDLMQLNVTYSNINCNSLCNGTATAAATSGVFSYLWSNGDTTSSISALCAGVYSVTVTDTSTCFKADSVIISEPADLSIGPSITDASCYGICDGSIVINENGGTSPYSYFWSNGSLNPPTCAGNYYVTITDANGCTFSDSLTIDQPPPIFLSSGNDTNICNGNSAIISANANGGAGTPYTFSWNNGLFQGDSITVNPAVSTCFSVIATDANGCSSAPDSQCVSLMQIPQPQISLIGDSLVCSVPGMANYEWYFYFGFDVWYPISECNGLQSCLCTGPTDYLVVISNSSGCLDSSAVFTATNCGVGIYPLFNNSPKISVYPNPAENIFFIEYYLKEEVIINIRLMDVLGKEIAICQNKKQSAGKQRLVMDASELSLAKGIYFLRFDMENSMQSIKIIVN